MAIPIQQTSAKIAKEALAKAGISSPDSEQLERTEQTFLRGVLGDICMSPERSFNRRLKSLQSVDVQTSQVGGSRYSVPTDFSEEISVTLLDSTYSGTAQAGSEFSITLEAGTSASEADIVGNYIYIYYGTGAYQIRQASSYSTSTLVAGVYEGFTTNPGALSRYIVVDNVTELCDDAIEEFMGIGQTFGTGMPSAYNRVTEAGTEYFIFDRPCDKSTYGIMTRYYADITKVDEDSALMLRLYRKWYQCLVYGVAAKVAEDEDDSKFQVFKAEYERLKGNIIAEETPHDQTFEGFEL